MHELFQLYLKVRVFPLAKTLLTNLNYERNQERKIVSDKILKSL